MFDNQRGIKYTEEQVRAICTAHGHIYLNNYVGVRLPMRVVCRCGNVGLISLMKIIEGQACGSCAEFRWRELFESYGCEITEYKKATEIYFICSCGSDAGPVQANNWLRGKHDCPACRAYWNSNPSLKEGHRSYVPGYRAWRLTALKEADYTCRACYTRTETLSVHHILPWAWYPELRLAQSNAYVMCWPCHREFHLQYGPNTDAKMLEDYQESYNVP